MPDTLPQHGALDNLFRPEFGHIPAFMAGRSRIIEDMATAFEEGRGNPNLCMLLVGARGMGKTALLSYLGREAQALGWVAVETSCTAGMLEDILQRVRASASHLLTPSVQKRVVSVGSPMVGSIGWEHEDVQLNWRSKMNLVLDELSRTETGLLITVDEADASLEELTTLVITYQHFVREGRKVSLLIAGLPFNVEAVLSGRSTSFLRRAARHDLSLLPSYEVEEAFRLTVEQGGRQIEQEALDEAVADIGGFPYMMQLLGYRAWKAAGTRLVIELRDVRSAAKIAQDELRHRVFDATFNELSKGDKKFLENMLADASRTERQDLAKRLGKKSGWISTYKKRLLSAGVIDEPEPGIFVFALSGFRNYLESKIR